MPRIITLQDIKLREILITQDPKLEVSLLFQRLDDTGAVHDSKRISLSEDDFTPTQVAKFTDILTAIKNKALSKEQI